jgi:chromosome segregation ATPase
MRRSQRRNLGHKGYSCRNRWTMTTNQSVLNETVSTQKQTRGALERIQRQVAETTAIGHATLESLEENNHRVDQVTKESKELNQKLKQTDKLQNRLSKWTFQLQNRREGRALAKKELKDKKVVFKVDQEKNLWPLVDHRTSRCRVSGRHDS